MRISSYRAEWFGILNFRSGGASSSLFLSSLKAGHLQKLSQRGSLGKEVWTDICFGFTANDFMVVTYIRCMLWFNFIVG